ncbi:MAG: hypothetical protein IPP29_19320 [Bacteroidetes bacterium]|nr:hypothetical protein [Bacteroidota bacterium]
MKLSKKIRQCLGAISLFAIFIVSCSNGIDAQNADQTSMLHLKGLSYDSLKITFFRFYSAVEPEDLSALGFHDNDSLWKDWSPNKIEKEKSFYKAMVNELTSRLVNGQLSTSQILDFQWMRTIAQFKVNFYDQNRHLANIRISSSNSYFDKPNIARSNFRQLSPSFLRALKSIGIRIQKFQHFLQYRKQIW